MTASAQGTGSEQAQAVPTALAAIPALSNDEAAIAAFAAATGDGRA